MQGVGCDGRFVVRHAPAVFEPREAAGVHLQRAQEGSSWAVHT